jgi:predicted RNase H-like HicB family nuclease
MIVGILFEKIQDKEFPAGYYYAHIPSLGLTTHGFGIEGAIEAAKDLINLWMAEKNANKETFNISPELLYSTIEINENAIQSA